MSLVRKYIIKELLFHFGIIFSLLFFIYISNQLIELLSKVASGKLPLIMIFKIMLLYGPEFFGVLIPISLFIATLFVISKLHADQELVVLFNAGLGWSFLFKIIMFIAGILALCSGLITLWVCPYLVEAREQILAKSESGILGSIIPGHFNVFNDGKNVLYVSEVDQDNNLKQVFISIQGHNYDPREINIITAKIGNLENNLEQNRAIITLKNGSKYSGMLGYTDFFVINFLEYTKQLFSKDRPSSNQIKSEKTLNLWRSKEPSAKAEYEWRLAMPISTLILGIIAISLGKVVPRQGRFAKFLPAILIYIIYSNSMLLMRRLVATGVVTRFLGIWVVHALFLCFGLLLLFHASGWLVYFKHKLFHNQR